MLGCTTRRSRPTSSTRRTAPDSADRASPPRSVQPRARLRKAIDYKVPPIPKDKVDCWVAGATDRDSKTRGGAAAGAPATARVVKRYGEAFEDVPCLPRRCRCRLSGLAIKLAVPR